MKKYVMALDQGTTSSRCILFDKKGTVLSQAQKEFTQIYPNPGWVEHDPNEIWSSQFGVMAEALGKIGAKASEVAALGITNQRETTIVWNRQTGQPVYNAIVWQCRRTADKIDKLKEDGLEDYIINTTGLIPDAYFSATKIQWILENVEGAAEEAKKGNLLFGTVDTWLMWKLSGGKIHATDETNASRTMLYDIHNRCWDKKLLDTLGIPESMLPKVQISSGLFGYTNEDIFSEQIPITGVAGDQQAALFGQCCFQSGEAKNTYGTGCFLLMHTGGKAMKSSHGLLTTMAAATKQDKPQYALEGSVFVAGAAVQWLRDELGLVKEAKETEDYANQVEDTNGMYMVPAFTGLGAPYWDQYARGAMFGLTRGIKKEHIIRAVLESLAYQTFDVLRAMEQDSDVPLAGLKVDGGACANNFLMQFQADVLGTEVIRPKVIETTALGAAYLAGLAVGYWKDLEDIKRNVVIDRVFKAEMDLTLANQKVEGWHKAVACTRGFTQN